MQRKQEGQFISDSNLNTMRFRRMSVPTTMQFIRIPVNRKLEFTHNKENLASIKDVNRCQTSKSIHTVKRIEKVQSDEI